MTRRSAALLIAGLLLLSLNLRPAAVSVGPVLAEVRAGLGMSAASAGLLTSLPVLAFACFGALAPLAARVVGVHRVTLLALLAVVGGLLGRVLVGGAPAFLALSMLALAGMAVANVLLPSLVKLHFPDRVGPVTALYTAALAVGLTAALTLTVPMAEGFGGWRAGLGAWAALALLAALPWVPLVAHDRAPDRAPHDVRFAEVASTRLGWAMAAFFGLQSLQAYAIFGWFATLWRDAGHGAGAAGALVGLVAATSIPLSLWLPAATARRRDPRAVLAAVMGCYPAGYVLLLLAPYSLAVPAAVLIGIGTVTFPLVLTLIGLRSRTAAGTAALSGFTQSAGYLLAAPGPFAVGAVHEATGGWTWPLLLLLALVVPLVAVGLRAARPGFVEDELGMRSGASGAVSR
ncbi:MFS transporter [Nocardioides ferulae]|uniref:MFS transporter n=1 Tax=Nocardioides ferulae TaxID=2340821 RepID=UPI001F0C4A37|nr:MFS transporter [Nocardioides ferulae]